MKKYALLLCFISLIMGCKNTKQTENAVIDTVMDNILTRTSVRAYTDRAVPDEMIETMLRAGMAAPSAMNRQPWEFVVVKDREVLDSLAGRLKHAKMLVQAPLAIVVCAQKTFTLNSTGETVVNNFWVDDASAATENILLAAHALGLGAVWTAASDAERAGAVREVLGIPSEIAPLCVIPIGFPGENPEPKDKWKPEKIHHDRW